MNSIKILHTGDLHLCSPMLNMEDKFQSRKGELLETFSAIINLAREEKVDAILIAGDFFENSNPDAETLDFITEQFEKISDIKVFVVLGNHDYALKCTFPSNVYVFGNYIEKVSIDNVDIYGVSFEEEHCNICAVDGFCADNESNINILLVHGDLASRSVYNPISEEHIKSSNMDYIALGHVHSHTGFNIAGSTTYAYCGIPEGRAFDECGEKGVVIAEVGNGYANCRFVPVCSRQYVCTDVDISGAKDNLEIAERISSVLAGTENAYRITLKGTKNTFVDCGFIKDFLEKDYYYAEIEDDAEEYSDEGYSLKNLFIENCTNEDALKYGLAALRGEKVRIE